MAQRRMFSKAIVKSEEFCVMPKSSQALYFHLGMEADDDGFIHPGQIMRAGGFQGDDLKILLAKRFLLTFESGVVVIKHWLIHNLIQKDRYTKTRYQEELDTLFIKENKAYTDNKPIRLQSVNKVLTQVRLGKVRLGKDTLAETSSAPFSLKEEIQKLEDSPRRDLNIIALYLDERKPDITTKAQLSVAIKRHLRPAKDLVPFTDNQILNAVPKAKKLSEEWTLETLVKILCK